MSGQFKFAHALVIAVGKEIVNHRERFLHCIAAFKAKVLHKTSVKGVGQHWNIPAEKTFEILGSAKVVSIIEVYVTTL